jgi:EAL domain-containing protein (putative c-di-GMP-specific phosphodiesterase class I)
VTPSQFIPIAEECGLIVPVGAFVLQEACAQARRWHDAGFPGLRIAVNVSAEQLRDAAFPDEVERIARDAGLASDRLEIELTESALMRDVDRALELLTRLKRKGFHVSIDDFGTGYSSLAYLKRFPIDCLKIDCSFVREVTTDAGDAAITAAILFMAHSLKLDVVAEGVETQEQLDFLRCHRCDQVQGFFFSEPLPAAAATAILEKQVVEPLEPIEPIGA